MDGHEFDAEALAEELARLREEHRALDAAVAAMHASGIVDQLQIRRLKRRKLELRDRMAWIEDRLTPDIIA